MREGYFGAIKAAEIVFERKEKDKKVL